MFNQVDNEINTALNSKSFWQNINILNKYITNIGNNLYIKEKVDLLLYKTINTSEYNKLLYLRNIEELEYMGVNLNSIQTIYTGKVVLLNNQYEIFKPIPNNTYYHSDNVYSLIALYEQVKNNPIQILGTVVKSALKSLTNGKLVTHINRDYDINTLNEKIYRGIDLGDEVYSRLRANGISLIIFK